LTSQFNVSYGLVLNLLSIYTLSQVPGLVLVGAFVIRYAQGGHRVFVSDAVHLQAREFCDRSFGNFLRVSDVLLHAFNRGAEALNSSLCLGVYLASLGMYMDMSLKLMAPHR
jgi:hypothetical protein